MAFAMPTWPSAPTGPQPGSIYYGAPVQQGGEYPWQQKMLGTMGAGNPFGVGGTGQPYTSGVGVPIGGGSGGTSGWGGALMDAYNQSQQSYDQGLKALGNSFSQGPFGQGLANMFNNPQGMSPEAYAGYLRQIRDREAGSRANALESLQNAGVASGFGNSMGLLDAGSRLRTQSAANLNDAELALLMASEQMKQGNRSMSGGLLAQLMGLDAAQMQALAQGYMNRPFQAFAPGAGTTNPWWGNAGGPPPGQIWGLPG